MIQVVDRYDHGIKAENSKVMTVLVLKCIEKNTGY